MGKVSSQYDQFNGIAKCDIGQSPYGVPKTTSNTFGGMAQQPCEGDNGDGIHREYNRRVQIRRLDGDSHGHKDKQGIDPAVAEGGLGVSHETDGAILHPDEKSRTFFAGIFIVFTMGIGGLGELPLRRPIHLGIIVRSRSVFGDARGGRSVVGGVILVCR